MLRLLRNWKSGLAWYSRILQGRPIEYRDIVAMSQAGYVAVDWGTSSFRLWLVDRAGGIVGERRSQEGMVMAAKSGFASVLRSHLDALAPRMSGRL